MKQPWPVVILCGGQGTRLRQDSEVRPKPMVEIGGKPVLWHIMHIYASYGYKEFIVALGYRGDIIKNYFLNYHHISCDVTVHLKNGRIRPRGAAREDWIVHLVDTDLETQTGGRVKRLAPWIQKRPFLLTYGDGVANIDIGHLTRFHRKHGKLATITAVRPPARFGGLRFKGVQVTDFTEKPQIGEGWINGGFFVFQPEVVKYIDNDQTILERDPLENLARDGQLIAYQHEKFWQCMDTPRDVRVLENLWASGRPPWKVWA